MSVVMVYGSGAREHALVWRLAQDPSVSRIIAVGGSPAWRGSTLEVWDDCSFGKLAKDARAAGVSLLVVGPDQALSDGIADVFRNEGIDTFGPSQKAARIESSKSFAKELMRDAGVPTAEFVVAQDQDEARRFLKSAPWGRGWVLKADGLALGKGVVVPDTVEQAIAALPQVFRLSKTVVIEERLEGVEVSWFALVAGNSVRLLAHARDHKRLQDGNLGPNTGGMGAISPSDDAPGLEEMALDKVFQPIARQLVSVGAPFHGVLFAGLMVGRDRQARVLEFNARFGDPEAQVILPRIKGDFHQILRSTAREELDRVGPIELAPDYAVYVVGAAPGYPGKINVGGAVAGLNPQDVKVRDPKYFVGGVIQARDGFAVKGGRVFGALGVGYSRELARQAAYENLKQVSFAGMQFRTDIG